MNAGFFLFLIAIGLMLVSTIIISIIVNYRNRKAKNRIREEIDSTKPRTSKTMDVENDEKIQIEVEEEISEPKSEKVFSTIREEIEQQGSYRIIVKTSISIVVLAVGLFIILSQKFGEDEKKWAYGSIGTVIGYWFR